MMSGQTDTSSSTNTNSASSPTGAHPANSDGSTTESITVDVDEKSLIYTPQASDEAAYGQLWSKSFISMLSGQQIFAAINGGDASLKAVSCSNVFPSCLFAHHDHHHDVTHAFACTLVEHSYHQATH
jgi:hypothetical protein